MSSKPTFVFVPGAFHGPECFDLTREYLSQQGFSSIGVKTPSPNSHPPVDSMKPDVDAVLAAVTPILDRGEDVVLAMHSYGGMIGTQASGLIFEDSKGKSGRGKLRRLVYISAWVPQEGEVTIGPQDVVKDFQPIYIGIEASRSGANTVANDLVLDWFWGDLPVEEQQRHRKSIAPGTHPIACFVTPVTHAGWKNIPSTYVYAKQDKAAPLEFQQWLVKRAQQEEPTEDRVRPFSGGLGEFSVDTAHCTMFFIPEKVKELGEILVEVAEGEKS